MPQSLEAGLPPMILTDGYKIAFEARDSSGNAVANVTISNPIIFADREGEIELEQLGPLMFVPGPNTVPA